MSGRATRMQTIPAPLLKWASLFLILLTVTVTIFSGNLPIARTNSKTFLVSTIGCIQFDPTSTDPEACQQTGRGGQGGNGNCLQFDTGSGKCTHFDTDSGNKPAPGGCEAWDQGQNGGYCTAFLVDDTPTCPQGGTPAGGCHNGAEPQCNGGPYSFDDESGLCVQFVSGQVFMGPSQTFQTNTPPQECPAPDTSSGVSSSSIQEITQTSQCYYSMSSGSCTAPYSTQAGPSDDTGYCVTFFKNFTAQTATSNQCTIPSGITVYRLPDLTCFYILPQSGRCRLGYTLEPSVPIDCLKGGQDINITPPNSVCPKSIRQSDSTTITFTPNPSTGICQANNGDSTFNITPTCRQGFIAVNSSGCLLNSGLFSLVDESSGPCSVSSTGYGDIGDLSGDIGDTSGIIYTCPYPNATLTCAINVPAVGSESCTMQGTLSSGTFIDYYTCTGLNPLTNLNPTGCIYHGNNAGNSRAQSTNCPSSSGLSTCSITACYDTSTGQYSSDQTTCSDLTKNQNKMQVNLNQKCTNQADGRFLTCTYANTSNALQDKVEDFKLSGCKLSPVVCTATGPYQRSIRKVCIPTDATNPGGAATCQIKDLKNSNKVLWVEYCSPSTNQSAFPHCDVYQANSSGGSTAKLGSIDCSGSSVTNTTCTIKDDSSNTMTISCIPGSPNTTEKCQAKTPDCPYTNTTTLGTGTAAVIESTIVCDGNLVVDELMGLGSPLLTDVQITYPLSQAQLEFVLAPPQLGIGSQSWTSELTQSHLPKVTAL